MADFKVQNIISADEIQTDGWSWNGVDGSHVKIRGLYQSDAVTGNARGVQERLRHLLVNNFVELKNAQFIPSVDGSDQIILCDVLLRGVNIKTYFFDF